MPNLRIVDTERPPADPADEEIPYRLACPELIVRVVTLPPVGFAPSTTQVQVWLNGRTLSRCCFPKPDDVRSQVTAAVELFIASEAQDG